MKTISTAISQRKQTTVPAAVLEELGLQANDRLTWIISDGQVRVQSAQFASIRDVFGSVKPIAASVDFDEQIEVAIEEHVADFWRKYQEE